MSRIADLLRKHLAESPRGEQARLVRELGVNKATMTKWLSNQMTPNGEHALTIVDLLKRKKGVAEMPTPRTDAFMAELCETPCNDWSRFSEKVKTFTGKIERENATMRIALQSIAAEASKIWISTASLPDCIKIHRLSETALAEIDAITV